MRGSCPFISEGGNCGSMRERQALNSKECLFIKGKECAKSDCPAWIELRQDGFCGIEAGITVFRGLYKLIRLVKRILKKD